MYYNQMQVETLEQRLREWKRGNVGVDASIKALKELEREIAAVMERGQVEEEERLSEMQIAVFNNLACLFEKKGKYRSSLYHLQIAEELQNKYFTHKYHMQPIPLPALQRLATTYSNLSAIQSKLGNIKEALLNAEFALQILNKPQNKDHPSLSTFYYNYSFLLDAVARYQQAFRTASQGQRLAQLYSQKNLIFKFQQLLARLKEKLARREERKIKQLKKHIKGQLGVFKSEAQVKQMLNEGIEEDLPTQTLSTLQQYFISEKRHLKPSTTINSQRQRHNSTFTTLTTHKNRNFSLTQRPLRTIRPPTQTRKQITQSELNLTAIPKEASDEQESSKAGKILRNRMENRLDHRMKSRRRRLEQEIEELSKRNEQLVKIIHRINSSENSHT